MNFLDKLFRSFKKSKRRQASKLSQTWKAKRNQSRKIREDARKCAERARTLTRIKGR